MILAQPDYKYLLNVKKWDYTSFISTETALSVLIETSW